MLYIKAWSAFAWQCPTLATVVAGIPFIVLSLLININDNAYSDGTPGVMVAAITILYLTLAAFVGLTSPLRVATIGPILAYATVTMLWPLVPGGETYESLKYESGWVGVVMSGIVIPSAVIWLFAFVGNAIGAARGDK